MPAAARSRVTTRNLLEPCLRAPVEHRLFVAAQPLRRISLPPSLDMPWGKAQSGPAAAIHTAVSSALTRTRLERHEHARMGAQRGDGGLARRSRPSRCRQQVKA